MLKGELRMKCTNCGHENDPDAKFCEKCGLTLNRSSMTSMTKILIVVIIVLVAGLGLVSAMMLMNNHKTISNITISTNNTTNTTNATSNQSPPPSNNTGNNINSSQSIISSAQAIAIADQTPHDADDFFQATYYPGPPPYYNVECIDGDPSSPNVGRAIGGEKIDAYTGQIISEMN